MSAITSGTGLFSGIDTTSLINQLLAIDAQPQQLAQQRVLQLQQQQAAYLGLNSKIQALLTASAAFRTGNLFQGTKATSSDPTVLNATTSSTAVPGSYSFVVDRLVSTQQYMSRGFADANTTGVNAGSFTFEPADGRLDRDTSLSDLNGGQGVSRGKIVITDNAGHATTVDLSRAGTVNDVLEAINGSGAGVTASIDDGKFVVASNSSATYTIGDAFGYSTAESLGIAASTATSTVTGSQVYSIGRDTALQALNDGNGVFLNAQSQSGRYDFSVNVTDGSGTTSVNVNIGNVYDAQGNITSPAVTTLGGAMDRINQALSTQFGNNHITASVASDGVSLQLQDSDGRQLQVVENPNANGTTAHDLGLTTSGPQTGSIHGARLLAGMNSTLARTLNGGQGIAGDGTISITSRDGTVSSVNIGTSDSLDEIMNEISQQTGGKVTAAVNQTGTGITLTDTTGGSNNFIVAGTSASSLGIATAAAGVASSTINSGSLQHQYMTLGTSLASLRNGQGVGSGSFRITDSTGASATVTVSDPNSSINDVIKNINSRGLRVQARINDKGDGILLYEPGTGGGAADITVQDSAGTVAAGLGIAGTAAGTGTQNFIDGSQEKTITFGATDTLQTVASKITAANIGVSAAVISDGGGSTPYRLSLSAKNSGSAGRFTLDTGSFDLGATQLDAGQDARVFFGSSDPARGVLLSSSQNTLDQVIPGVSIDLNSVSTAPVTLNVTRDTDTLDTAMQTFVSAFNSVVDNITSATAYDQDSDTKGVLLGDQTTLSIRDGLYNTIQGKAIGVNSTSGFSTFADIGLTVGDNGDLSLDETKFRNALQQDYQGVADLVAARVQQPNQTVQLGAGITSTDPNAPPVFTSLGLASQMENLSNSFIDSVSGVLTRQNNTLNDQIALQNQNIADMQDMLDSKRQVLQQQFLDMEEAIGSLQQQQSALGSIK